MTDKLLAALAVTVGWLGVAHAGCGPVAEACATVDGIYHIELPEPLPAEPAPALMFLHGYGSSGEATLRNRGLVEAALARGFAVIAPSGTEMQGRGGRTWSFHPDRPQRRDKIGFLTEVRDDAVARFGLDPDRIVLGGFSIGGSMASYLACAAPERFAAYVPVSGSFWRPHPEGCAGPVKLLHTHGWTDEVVPLEGRYIGGLTVAQGDVFHAMTLWRAVNGCDEMRADTFPEMENFWRRKWERCAPDTALEFALFPGGHSVPKGWADMALDWYEDLGSGG